jgi:hypothetical protein
MTKKMNRYRGTEVEKRATEEGKEDLAVLLLFLRSSSLFSVPLHPEAVDLFSASSPFFLCASV